ncbi:hypothetical protein ACOSOMT5_P0613 [Acidiphilium sp. MT5]
MTNRTTSRCTFAMKGLSVFTVGSSDALHTGCKNCAPVESPEQELTDREALCLLFCCCNANPSTEIPPGEEAYNLGSWLVATAAADPIKPKKVIDFRQQCVSDTLRDANRLAAYQSRFKPEISYNMSTNPPSPFMHRDGGLDTTEPSRNWITRARTEIPNFTAGAGLVRRPDVVVVSNPTQPPIQSNIDHVYEMKFPGDEYDDKQMRAYARIAGGKKKASLLNAENCGCGDEKMKQKVHFLLPKSVSQQSEKHILSILQNPGALPWPEDIPLPEPFPEPIPFPVP